MTDYINNDPEAQTNIRAAQKILEQQGTINDLRRVIVDLRHKEGELAHKLLAWRARLDDGADVRPGLIRIPVTTAALALATLLRLCEATTTGTMSPWIDDRIAAAELAGVLNLRDQSDTSVPLDVRSAESAAAALRYMLAHKQALDPDVTELAALDIENALKALKAAS